MIFNFLNEMRRGQRTEKISFLKEIVSLTSNLTQANLNNATIFSSHRGDLQELQGKFSDSQKRFAAKSELSIKKENIIEPEPPLSPPAPSIFIKTKDNVNIELRLDDIATFSILDMKKKAFPTLFSEKNIRIIYKGRLLNDTESIMTLGFESGSFLHAFISEKIDPQERTATIPDYNQNANQSRGFDRLKDLGVPTEDIILQKIAFHANFVVSSKVEEIDFNCLVNREEDWFAINIEKIRTENWFSKFPFYANNNPERKEKIKDVNGWILFLMVIMGFLLMVLILPLLYFKKINGKIKEAWVIGLVLKILYVSGCMFIFNEVRIFF